MNEIRFIIFLLVLVYLVVSIYWLVWLPTWVLFDALKRKNNCIGWPVFTFLAGAIGLYVVSDLPTNTGWSIYLAKRNLLVGEIRKYKEIWYELRYFVIIWSVIWEFVFLFTLIMYILMIIILPDRIYEETEKLIKIITGVEVSINEGMREVILLLLFFINAVPAGVIVLLVGLLFKKHAIVERGPSDVAN